LNSRTEEKILLLNAPWSAGARTGVRAGSRWPFTLEPISGAGYLPFPFFLAYATALLKENGHGAMLLDALAEGIDRDALYERIRSQAFSLIVIETSTPSFANDLEIAVEIHRRLPQARIAFCGPHASVFATQILQEHDFVSFVLQGEYEFTLLELASALEKGDSLSAIAGLAFREEGTIRRNSRRNTIQDLDILPWPERQDVPIYRYNDGFAGMPVPNVQMWSSRGCPYRCLYCLWPQTMYAEHRHRKRQPAKVIDEMEYLLKKYAFKAVYFDDDIFNADRKHVIGICNQIKKRGIEVAWAAMARAELMDEGLLRLMRSSGLYAVKYGIESANKHVLSRCRKGANLKKARRMVKVSKDLGIKVHLTFCLGLPGESIESVEETAAFCREVKPDSLQCSLAVPFPGTEFFNLMRSAKQIVSERWDDYDGNRCCVHKTEKLEPGQLEELWRAFSDNCNV